MTSRPGRARLRRRLLRAGLALLAAFVLLALSVPVAIGAFLTTQARTRPQDLELRSTPMDYGLSFRTVALRAADGAAISAWMIRPAGSAPGRGCAAVLAHGLFRSRREVLPRAAWLARSGCAVVTPDLRSHGRSARSRSTLGFTERLDVLAAAEFLRREFPDRPLFLLGVSMGGAAAAGAAVAAATPPAGVVLDSTFKSARTAVARYTTLLTSLPERGTTDLVLLGMRLFGGFRPRAMDVEALSRSLGERGVPILLLAGGRDRRAPPDDQRAVFEANGLPASRFVTVPEATHGRPCLSAPEACEAAIAEFFGLSPAGSPAAEPGGYRPAPPSFAGRGPSPPGAPPRSALRADGGSPDFLHGLLTARGKSAPPSTPRREGAKSAFGFAAGRSSHGRAARIAARFPP